jgi:3-deoxy-D-manno-octulosonic-acid transferase
MNLVLRALYAGAGLVTRLAVAANVGGESKIGRSVAARRGLMERYRSFGETKRIVAQPLVWFHAPSVGEGLQATPVMSQLRELQPAMQQAYTHFSPSAEAFARRVGAEFADYLPFDTATHMRAALDALQPTALVFSKLDVWPVLVAEAQARGVALGLISATLAESSTRRRGLSAALTRDAYAALDRVGAIDAADAARLVELGVRERAVEVTGDTRYDQVWARAQQAATSAPWLERFRGVPRITLVAGSTWHADEAVLLAEWHVLSRASSGRLRLIIAPHEPTSAHIVTIENWARVAGVRTARLGEAGDVEADVVIVDRVGVLGELYALADVAFVGGGFHDAGLHSVIEPAAFGAPVIFGPQHRASRDAAVLLAAGGARAVSDAREMREALTVWLDAEQRHACVQAGSTARQVVQRGLGAADRATALVMALIDGRH